MPLLLALAARALPPLIVWLALPARGAAAASPPIVAAAAVAVADGTAAAATKGGARTAPDEAAKAGAAPIAASAPATSAGAPAPPDDAAARARCAPPLPLTLPVGQERQVGHGTAASCTEAALVAAVRRGGFITFSCGGAATIPITAQIELPRDVDTVLDGADQITLDGGGRTRLLHFDGGNYRATRTTVTLQRLTLRGGAARGTAIAAAPPPCAQGTHLDGGGGALWINDGILHVFGARFVDNHGADRGPDVAGGALYATGALEVVVVRSEFTGNSAANGGAVGSLNSDLSVYNSRFVRNAARGSGANRVDASCPVAGGQVGDGGNGGAIAIDGGDGGRVVLCGDVFAGNRAGAGALGGAVFRTPDGAPQVTHIDQSLFDGNEGDAAGALYFHNSLLQITASTVAHTRSGGAAIQVDGTELTMINVTLANNVGDAAPGAAIALFGNRAELHSCTFAGNRATAGPRVGFAADLFAFGAVTLHNTLVTGTASSDGGAPMSCAQVYSDGDGGGGNLQWPPTKTLGGADPGCTPGITFADPQLRPLADHGGPTPTLLPASSGPAAGRGAHCPPTDQRGRPRPPGRCTAGAVQL